MADFLPADIAGAQARGRQNALAFESAREGINSQKKQNVLLDLNIDNTQTVSDQRNTQFGQGQAVQKARMLGQVADALASIPEGQRQQAAMRIDQQYPELNLRLSEVPPENLSNDGLARLKSVSEAIGRDPKAFLQKSSAERNRADLVSNISGSVNPATGKPFTPEEAAREVALRDAGIVAKAGTFTGAERTATTPGLTDKVAYSEGEIAGSKEKSKLGEQLKLKPQIETAVAEAKAEVKRRVDLASKEFVGANKLDDAMPIYEALSSGDLSSIYGRGESIYPALLRSQDGIDLMAQRDQFVNMLKVGARGELKGQGTISDNETKMLADAVTVLGNSEISPTLAKAAIDDAMAVLRRTAGKPSLPSGVTEEDIRFTMEKHGVTREEVLKRLSGG